MVSLEAISGLGNQKKSLLINELVALGDSLHPLHCRLLRRRLPSGQFLLQLAPSGFACLDQGIPVVRRVSASEHLLEHRV